MCNRPIGAPPGDRFKLAHEQVASPHPRRCFRPTTTLRFGEIPPFARRVQNTLYASQILAAARRRYNLSLKLDLAGAYARPLTLEPLGAIGCLRLQKPNRLLDD